MPSKSRPADTAALVSEQAIRERAYLLWEAAGRPDGAGDYYWNLAQAEAARALAASTAEPARSKHPQEPPAALKAGKAAKAKAVEGEAGKPKAKAKTAKPARKATPEPRAALQKPK